MRPTRSTALHLKRPVRNSAMIPLPDADTMAPAAALPGTLASQLDRLVQRLCDEQLASRRVLES